MTTPGPTPAFKIGPDAPPRKRMLWRWSLSATAVVLLFLIWQCGTALYEGRGLANTATREFHQRLNDGQCEEICREADERFTSTSTQEDVVKFLEAVHTKLGNARASTLEGIHVNTTPGGTLLVTSYKTMFDRGPAIETFTWKKSSGALRLYGYNIQSKALVLN